MDFDRNFIARTKLNFGLIWRWNSTYILVQAPMLHFVPGKVFFTFVTESTRSLIYCNNIFRFTQPSYFTFVVLCFNHSRCNMIKYHFHYKWDKTVLVIIPIAPAICGDLQTSLNSPIMGSAYWILTWLLWIYFSCSICCDLYYSTCECRKAVYAYQCHISYLNRFGHILE